MASVRLYHALHGSKRKPDELLSDLDRHAHIAGILASLIAAIVLVCYALGQI